MRDDELESDPLKMGLIELLASWEPLPEEDSMPEIDDPPPAPITCFDHWVDDPE